MLSSYISGNGFSPVMEGWSPWSMWSPCDEDCIRHRQRSCLSPKAAANFEATSNGHRRQFPDDPCSGPDRDVDVCTGGMCDRGKEKYRQGLLTFFHD